MKKFLSIMMACMMFLCSFTFGANATAKKALPTSAGIDALRAQFQDGIAPQTDGKQLDYVYYSPVGKSDKTKYPVVIFLHGIGHGGSKGSQLADSDMPYWASAELQSRFSDGGAFILMPRAPENKSEFWGESFIEPLRALIDDFIAKHKDNVDTTRISITGSSQGGAMVWMMLDTHPEYFATAFPIASTKTPTSGLIKYASGTAIWMIASKKDPVINYALATLPVWNDVCKYNDHPENCRLSTFGTVYNPDGTKSSDNHHLAGVITYDLHMLDNSNFDDMTTVNGKGQTVVLNAPNGLIKWISSIHSGFKGTASSSETFVSFLKRIVEVLRNVLLQIVHIVQVILGL